MVSGTAMAVYAAIIAAVGTAYDVHEQSVAARDRQISINKQLKIRQNNLSAAKSEQANVRQKQAWAERGHIRAAASSSGLSLGSQSVESQLMNSLFQQGFDLGTINKSQNMQELANYARAQSAYNSVYDPSQLGAALQIGTSGTGAYINNGGTFG